MVFDLYGRRATATKPTLDAANQRRRRKHGCPYSSYCSPGSSNRSGIGRCLLTRARGTSQWPDDLNTKSMFWLCPAKTVIFCVVVPSFSCQACTVYSPGGTLDRSKFPSLLVTAKKGCLKTAI